MEDDLLKKVRKYVKYDGKSNAEYEKADKCHLCGKPLLDDKVDIEVLHINYAILTMENDT